MSPVERLFKMVNGGSRIIGRLPGTIEGLVVETTIFMDDPSVEDLAENDVEFMIVERAQKALPSNSLISLQEVSEETGIPTATLRDWCAKARVRSVMIDGKWFLRGRIVSAQKIARRWRFKQLAEGE